VATVARIHLTLFSFFFYGPAPPEIYTLSLHDALPIWYSAFPESAAASVTMRKPGSRFCSTSVVSESTTLALAGTRRARNIGLSRSEEHTSELQSRGHLVCRLLLEKKNRDIYRHSR